jgi:RNAse (barnase) inhibitor barstar
MSDALWVDVVGKMRDVAYDEVGQCLSLCVDECSADVLTVDLRHAVTQQDVLMTMASRLHFPGYFGVNLDALYDVVSERLLPEYLISPPQVWLFKSDMAQQKMLFPTKDTLRDVMTEAVDVRITVLWWTI